MYIIYYHVLVLFIWLVFVAPFLGKKNSQVRTRKILFGDLLERVDKHLEQFDVVLWLQSLVFFFDMKKTSPEVNGILDIYIYVCMYIYICPMCMLYIYFFSCLFFLGGGGRPVIPNLSRWPWMFLGVDKKLCIPLESKVFFWYHGIGCNPEIVERRGCKQLHGSAECSKRYDQVPCKRNQISFTI